MFSLQLHIPLASPLGQRVSLVQHLVALAVVKSILKQPGYEVSNHFMLLLSSFVSSNIIYRKIYRFKYMILFPTNYSHISLIHCH